MYNYVHIRDSTCLKVEEHTVWSIYCHLYFVTQFHSQDEFLEKNHGRCNLLLSDRQEGWVVSSIIIMK